EAAHPSHDAGPRSGRTPCRKVVHDHHTEHSRPQCTSGPPAGHPHRPRRHRGLPAPRPDPLGGDTFDNIVSNDATDKYVKLLFADPAHGLVPPYDLTELREQSPEKLPSRRTYTIREID